MTDAATVSPRSAALYTFMGAVVGGVFSLLGSYLGAINTNEARFHEVEVQLAAQERRDDVSTRRAAYVAFVGEASQLRDELIDLLVAIELGEQAGYTKEREEFEAARALTYTAAATVYLVGDRASNRAAVAFTEAAGAGLAIEVGDADASAVREWLEQSDTALDEFLTAADGDLPERASPSP